MKNIHILQTDKSSRLYEFGGQIILTNEPTVAFRNQHIYITNSEEVKDGYFINCDMICKFDESKVSKEWITDEFVNGYSLKTNVYYSFETEKCKKIILTTDQDLIKDGVQAIDNEFLEWFVKNTSCEEVEVIKEYKDGYGCWYKYQDDFFSDHFKPFAIRYKIITQKEEPKQETLEEAAEKLFGSLEKGIGADRRSIWMNGAKWQQEQILQFLYSEITERRPYSSSKMCEKVIEFIEQLNIKK